MRAVQVEESVPVVLVSVAPPRWMTPLLLRIEALAVSVHQWRRSASIQKMG
jgi:hypothetical protein